MTNVGCVLGGGTDTHILRPKVPVLVMPVKETGDSHTGDGKSWLFLYWRGRIPRAPLTSPF